MDTTQLHEAYNSLVVAITHFFQHSIPVWQVLISATVISICQYYLLKLGALKEMYRVICPYDDTRVDVFLIRITANFNSFASY
jgi:hypothetical protein